MSTDFHLHTLVSDGELTPVELVRHAAARGVRALAITDHDTLGAYAWADGAVFAEAERLGLALTVGMEIDADLDGLEVHLLGLELDSGDPGLRAHVAAVRAARVERARAELPIVNDLLGAGSLSEADLLVPGRETVMRPHFIRPLLARGRFESYREANAWFRAHVESGVPVPKPSLEDAIALVHAAGGAAVLAHPGYYQRAGLPVAERLAVLRGLGLDGVELEYPYHSCSKDQFSLGEETAFVAEVRAAGEALGMRLTRGSDCHTAADFDRVYGPAGGGS
jgi:predicted metal-dependent phosphoesterase TrpH